MALIGATFTATERLALVDLRRHYSQAHEIFSEAELAHLGFLRWLYETGRFGSDGLPQVAVIAPSCSVAEV